MHDGANLYKLKWRSAKYKKKIKWGARDTKIHITYAALGNYSVSIEYHWQQSVFSFHMKIRL